MAVVSLESRVPIPVNVPCMIQALWTMLINWYEKLEKVVRRFYHTFFCRRLKLTVPMHMSQSSAPRPHDVIRIQIRRPTTPAHRIMKITVTAKMAAARPSGCIVSAMFGVVQPTMVGFLDYRFNTFERFRQRLKSHVYRVDQVLITIG